MIDRPDKGNRAVLVGLDMRGVDWDRQEFSRLAQSAGATVVGVVTGRRKTPDPRLFMGLGKAEEVRQAVVDHSADLVLVDHALSPSQERNLEKELSCRVLDRSGLILDIFAQRARSYEGKLQVELAQLRHLSTRLVRGWTHLERQGGGIGLRGPGETQLETDRRLVAKRIQHLEQRLEKVAKQRRQGRSSRTNALVPSVALVGYTNSGKSTLFNKLTGDDVLAADKLFATLDTTARRLHLSGETVILVDTVGFIRDLPHDLIAAFRATLEETLEADLLLHVIDAADPDRQEREKEVLAVLATIGADDLPCMRVYNKIDACGLEARVDSPGDAGLPNLWVSAITGEGLENLRLAMTEFFFGGTVHGRVRLTLDRANLRSRLFDEGVVLGEVAEDDGWLLEVKLPESAYRELCQQAVWSDPILH